jgi:hypothetical protein
LAALDDGAAAVDVYPETATGTVAGFAPTTVIPPP